jgi:hypothetical protein
MSGFDADMTLSQQAGFIGELCRHLQQGLVFQSRDWEKMGRFLGCPPSPSSIISAVVKLTEEKESLLSRIEELEEKRGTMEKEFRESMEELGIRRRQVEDITKKGESLKRE